MCVNVNVCLEAGGGAERGAEKDAHNSVLKFQDKSYLLGIFFGVHTGK